MPARLFLPTVRSFAVAMQILTQIKISRSYWGDHDRKLPIRFQSGHRMPGPGNQVASPQKISLDGREGYSPGHILLRRDTKRALSQCPLLTQRGQASAKIGMFRLGKNSPRNTTLERCRRALCCNSSGSDACSNW